jgi:putative restriction endonuclease
MSIIFGEIPGCKEGARFNSFAEMNANSVHRPSNAGIGGSQYVGADSIVISGGYEDDEDHWSYVIDLPPKSCTNV